MANRINNRRYNKLLSYRNNYYMYGSQMQNDPYRLNGKYSTPAIVNGMGGVQNPSQGYEPIGTPPSATGGGLFGNLGTSIAIVGAFSLVRFRSLPGTSKEILSVFFAMAIGLATGMGHIFFATIMTIIVSLSIIVFNKFKFFDLNPNIKTLKIVIPENLEYTNMFDEIFEKYVKEYTLEQVKTTNRGSLFELKYYITFKPNINEKEFIDEIRIRNGNLKISLSHENDGTEM